MLFQEKTPQILCDYPLDYLNSFNLHAIAKYYIGLDTVYDIKSFLNSFNIKQSNFYILGGGTNTLFRDNIYNGYILHVRIPGIEILEEQKDQVRIKANAGVIWNELVEFCVAKGYGGIENLVLIPGITKHLPPPLSEKGDD